MEKLTQWIAEHPTVTTWVTLFSLLGVVISFFAFVIQLRDKKKRAINYIINSNVLLDNAVSCIEGIKAFFYGEEVKTIVVSTIEIWNGGNEILEMSDFYPENNIKIKMPENEKILSASVTEEADTTCKVKTNIINDKEIELSFYCLEPRQGATIVIYHTNICEDTIIVNGKIKGGKIVNKSMEIHTENGKLIISNGHYKFYLNNSLYSVFFNLFEILLGNIKMKNTKSNVKK